ncbi:nucleotidyltransferase family protein [Parabacteroides johnsonii]|nr:nucleotidyltransferase family protein [Parabacteroides johnsonii]MBP3640657.1 nucleotidyltransferase family protein [Parabacteroides sp.]
MNKKTVLNKLSLLKEKLSSQYGVDKIGLFGSVIRGENRKNSDIDILVDFQEGKETYQNFLSVCDILEELFEKHKLDIVTLKGLSPFIGKQILNEVEYV